MPIEMLLAMREPEARRDRQRHRCLLCGVFLPVVGRVLGPVEAVVGNRVVELGPPKQRAVLVLLASRIGQPVAAEVLVEELWAGSPPAAAMTSLQTYVANLRPITSPLSCGG